MHAPSPAALVFAQDKLAMRRRLTEIDVACPAWAQARTATDVEDFAAQVGWPIVAKTRAAATTARVCGWSPA